MPNGINIAFASHTLSTSPTWVRIDDPIQPVLGAHNAVSAWTSDRGRQYELDKTQAGTATLTLQDVGGYFDPTNHSSPFFGNIGPLRQFKISVQNPCDGSYHDMFTGFVESWDYTITQEEAMMVTTVNATDGFELIARAEIVPDATGVANYAPAQVNDRINAALDDMNWPTGILWRNIFSGNVYMQTSSYNPQSSILGVIQDAADAEFPNVANIFMDRWGRVAFRGRWARLNPSAYESRSLNANPEPGSNQIYVWNVGDREAAETFNYAPINDIEWILDLKNVVNACLCIPYGLNQTQYAGQLITNTASIAKYGIRSFTIPDIFVLASIAGPTSGQPGGDGVHAPSAGPAAECQLFADYYAQNYAEPVEMISRIQFKSIAPTDSLGPAMWQFLTGVEIGDIVVVTQKNPGGGGFSRKQFFVEGIHNEVNPLTAKYPDWTMTLDLSPRDWYQQFNGVTYFSP